MEKCPSCGEHFEKGYLMAGKGVYWGDSIPKWSFHGKERMTPQGFTWTGFPNIPALRCRQCGIIRY